MRSPIWVCKNCCNWFSLFCCNVQSCLLSMRFWPQLVMMFKQLRKLIKDIVRMKIPNRCSGMLMDNLIPSFCQFIEIDYLRCLILQLACEWKAWTNCWSPSNLWIEHILLQYIRACSWETRMFRGGQNHWAHWCKLSRFEYTICSQVFPFLVSTSSTITADGNEFVHTPNSFAMCS